MAKLLWDQSGERVYETGADHGVLYLRDPDTGDYDNGVVWNGLTTVTESPSGAEATPQYADNIKYLNLVSAEQFGATIEALTYPNEFGRCDGTAEPETGVHVSQQTRETFGFSYRTLVGNDITPDAGYKIHLVYGALAAPSEKARATVNDTPEATAFSWQLTTTPVAVGIVDGKEYKPTAKLTIDSTTADATILADLELILYGDTAVDPRLPLPEEVISLFSGAAPTPVNLNGANAPTYNAGTHVVTLPAVTGVQWKINGVNKPNGAQPAMTVGQTSTITPVLADGYVLAPGSDDDWVYIY